ncbi:hypothetical protein K440DRAFT_643895 [Wilcoxina mikolae CBS 423.85]|nr:hypothetical protein K440DRAFT_643895 [Wilcoxina mikolae CBS 423.85]
MYRFVWVSLKSAGIPDSSFAERESFDSQLKFEENNKRPKADEEVGGSPLKIVRESDPTTYDSRSSSFPRRSSHWSRQRGEPGSSWWHQTVLQPLHPPAGTNSILWFYGTQNPAADGKKDWNCSFCPTQYFTPNMTQCFGHLEHRHGLPRDQL